METLIVRTAGNSLKDKKVHHGNQIGRGRGTNKRTEQEQTIGGNVRRLHRVSLRDTRTRRGCKCKVVSSRVAEQRRGRELGGCPCSGVASVSDGAVAGRRAPQRAVDVCGGFRRLALAAARGEWVLAGKVPLRALAIQFVVIRFHDTDSRTCVAMEMHGRWEHVGRKGKFERTERQVRDDETA